MEKKLLRKMFPTLITEVHKHETLWKTTHINYHNRCEIDRLWEKVAHRVKIPKEECRKKWKNLRDRYRIELKRIDKYAKNGQVFTSRWPFFKNMEFVAEFMQPYVKLPPPKEIEIVNNCKDDFYAYDDDSDDSNIGTNKIDVIKNEIDLDGDKVISEAQHFCNTTNELSNNADSDVTTFKTEKIEIVEDMDHKYYYTYKEVQMPTTTHTIPAVNSKETDSEDLLFFKSLLGYMEKFSPVQKLRVRNQITTVIINELTDSARREKFSSMEIKQ